MRLLKFSAEPFATLTPHPFSLRTYEALTAAGIPCTMVLDSAVAYVMDQVDFVLVGSEAVVESGGLVNYVGSNQMAIIAKAANKPFYALAERWVRQAGICRTFLNLLSCCPATNSIVCSRYRNTICRRTIRISCPSLLRQGDHLGRKACHQLRHRTPRSLQTRTCHRRGRNGR